MKRFCIRCSAFLLPLVLVLVPAMYHLESFRELESIHEMAGENQSNERLVGLAYADPMHFIKHEILKQRQPEVIALGTSRVLPIRCFLFENPERFYNCGRSVGKMQDLKSFLASYPGKKPKVIILGLDQDFFCVDDEDLDREPRSYICKETSYGTRLVKGTKALFDALKDGELATGKARQGAEHHIGRNACLYYEGYRSDGSYLYGRRLLGVGDDDDYSFARTISRIEKRKGRFVTTERIHSGAVSELNDFILKCKAEGIHVVAFLPPYANKVYRRFDEERSKFPHVFTLWAELKPLFTESGFRLFDFSNLKSVGSNDYETYDGFHASEPAYLKIIQSMARNDAVLAPFVDQGETGKMLKTLYSARQIHAEVIESEPKQPAVSGR